MRTRTFVLFCLLLASGYLPAQAQPQPGSLLWSFDLGKTIGGAPALAEDGTAYVVAYQGLYAITNNGVTASSRWVVPGRFYGSAAVGAHGTIYVGDGSFLYAINPDGGRAWAASPGGDGPPAVALDGTLYVLSRGLLSAITPSGSIKWTNSIDDGSDSGSVSSPVIGPDGTVYVCSIFGSLHALAPDGSQKWVIPDDTGDAFPIVARDGTIYARTPFLSALTSAGTNIWTATNGYLGAPASLGLDGTLYFAQDFGVNLNAFSSSGQRLWQAVPVVQTNVPTTSPAIDSAGTIYHATSNAVFAVSPQGTVLWTFQTSYPVSVASPVIQTSPTIGPDGTIYASVDSTLYALHNTNKLANSAWPMFRQNPRHTGSVERPVLKQPQKRSDGGFHFQLYAQPGQALDIQTTADFVTWGSLTNLVVTNPPMDVLDLTAGSADLRYYRAASPP
jgi:outer membrane protein assembly factor BamB